MHFSPKPSSPSLQNAHSTPKFDRAMNRTLKLRGLLRELRESSASREKMYHSIKLASFQKMESFYSTSYCLFEEDEKSRLESCFTNILKKCGKVLCSADNEDIEREMVDLIKERKRQEVNKRELKQILSRQKL